MPPVDTPSQHIPAWTADARWYYVKIPRFRNGDKANDPEGTLPWTSVWPPLEKGEDAPREKTGEPLAPHARRYGGDLRGVIDGIQYLKKLGVNAICLSPTFHGAAERKVAQIDLRHVDDDIGVRGGFSQANSEGSSPSSWVWTSSDKVLRELIHTAHENGIRVVISGIFYAVMTSNSPPAEQESYYLAATTRWMDPDGDGNPLDGVDGWLHSVEEGPLRAFDEKSKAFWHRWRDHVRKLNPNAVVISSGTLALSQLAGGPYDVALHSARAAPIVEIFGIQIGSKPHARALFDSIESAVSLAPGPTAMSNFGLISGGQQSARLLTALAAQEPLRKGRQLSPGPVPDEAAYASAKLASVVHHLLPGAPMTWYGDEVGMFGGPGEYADGPMWWLEGISDSVRNQHYRSDFYALIQWLHSMREAYPALRQGGFRRVLMDDANKVLAFSRDIPGEEVVVAVNYGQTKQMVMLPAGKPGQMVGVRSPHLRPGRGDKVTKPDTPADQVEPLSISGARQFVNPEGKIRMWLDPMSVRLIFLGVEKKE